MQIESLFTILLIFHITGGTLGLISGTLNLLFEKGDLKHKIIGKLFFYGMLATGFSSLLLAFIHPNYFLFMVGVFTLYLVRTGNRYIYLKMLGNGGNPSPGDWFITVAMLVFGFLFIGLGSIQLLKGNFFGIVFIVFGMIGLLFVKADLNNYRGKSKLKNYWLIAHLQRMCGAYIASLTAFLVVNAQYSPIELPGFIYWLLPSAVLAPLITYWSRKFEIKK